MRRAGGWPCRRRRSKGALQHNTTQHATGGNPGMAMPAQHARQPPMTAQPQPQAQPAQPSPSLQLASGPLSAAGCGAGGPASEGGKQSCAACPACAPWLQEGKSTGRQVGGQAGQRMGRWVGGRQRAILGVPLEVRAHSHRPRHRLPSVLAVPPLPPRTFRELWHQREGGEDDHAAGRCSMLEQVWQRLV